jgi:hypothetical protein
MKKPTSNGNDLYQIGNDYPQAPISSYFVPSSYKDGIYTEIVNSGYKTTSKDGYDDSFFLGKEPVGLNKRVFNVAQSEFDVEATDVVPSGALSAVSGELFLADEYATGVLSAFPQE